MMYRLRFRIILCAAWLLATVQTAQAGDAGLDPGALPAGGDIAVGGGTISSAGAQLLIEQTSDRLITNWQSFSVGQDAAVTFQQPGANAVALNRVLGSAGSQVLGRLSANGHVFLINPNGVLFGKDARVDVGGLVASTLDISNEDFLAGRYVFTGNGAGGAVVNEATLTATPPGGFIALLAPEVINDGVVVARLGTAALAAGERVMLDFQGDGLVRVTVDRAALDAHISNRGLVIADGGLVVMSARAANEVLGGVINSSGGVEAKSLVERAGKVYLDGGGHGSVYVSGTLDASGIEPGAHGGDITVLGDEVGLMAGTRLDASGERGGGAVLVGGNWQGEGPEPNANAVYMDQSATIKADASAAGDGGTVVLWSQQHTGFYGSISARGGAEGGRGGQVETSSAGHLRTQGRVDAAAPAGRAGLWLLDPADVTITTSTSNGSFDGGTPDVFAPSAGASASTVDAATISAALDAGTSVTITTTNTGAAAGGNGDITVNAAVSKTAGGDATLVLQADRSIRVNADLVASAGRLDIVLAAHYASDAAGGSIHINGATLNSNGGNIVLGGGTGVTATSAGVGARGVLGEATLAGRGILIADGATLDAVGGHIYISGNGASGGASAADRVTGVEISIGGAAANTANTIRTSGAGTVAITGAAGSTAAGCCARGVAFHTGQSAAENVITAQNGPITIVGAAGSAPTGTSSGISFGGSAATSGSTRIYTSGTGNLTLSSTGAMSFADGPTHVRLGWNGASITTGGTVTIAATTSIDPTNTASAPAIRSANATGAIAVTAATGITGAGTAPVMTATNNGAISVTNTTSGDVLLGALSAGTGSITLTNGTAGAPGAGALRTDTITGGTISIKDLFTGSGSTLATGAIAASGNVDLWQSANNADLSIGEAASIAALTQNSNGPSTLTVKSGRSISVSPAALSVTGSGAASMVFDAHYLSDTAGGAFYLSAAGTLDTKGGHVTIGGGVNPAITPAIGVPGQTATLGRGVLIASGANIAANGGNIIINGRGAGASIAGDTPYGIDIASSGTATSITTTGAGTIVLTGAGGAGAATTNSSGIAFNKSSTTGITLSTASGAITLTGTGGTIGTNRAGVWLNNTNATSSVSLFSNGGALTLNGIALDNAAAAIQSAATGSNNIGWDGSTTITSGDVTLRGQTPATSTAGATGISLAATTSVIRGNGGNLTIGAYGQGLSGLTLNSGNVHGSSLWNNVAIGDDSTVFVDISTALAAGGAGTLTLSAGGKYNGVPGAGQVRINGVSLTTAGGNINVSNSMLGAVNEEGGIRTTGTTTLIDAGGGHVTMTGYGSGGSNSWKAGIMLYPATIRTSGTGTITLTGTSTGSSGQAPGIHFGSLGAWAIYTTGSGAISITGTGGSAGGVNDGGLEFPGPASTLRIYSGSGDITLTGRTAGASASAVYFSGGGTASNTIYIGWDGASANGTTGNIRILGETPTASTAGINGIRLGSTNNSVLQIKGSGSLLIGNGNTGSSGTLSGIALGRSGAGVLASGQTFTSITLGSNGAGTTGAIQVYATSTAAYQVSGAGTITAKAAGGLVFDTATMTTAGGAITIQSTGDGTLQLQSGTSLYANGGDITIANTDATAAGHGTVFTGAGTISAGTGSLSIYGKASNNSGAYHGVLLGGTTSISTTSGNISIAGVGAGGSNNKAVYATGTNYIGWNGAGAGTTGNISILGATPTISTQGVGALDLGSTVIKGSGALTVGNATSGTAYLAGLYLRAGSVAAGSAFTSISIGNNGSGTTGTIQIDNSMYVATGAGTITVATTGNGTQAGNVTIAGAAFTTAGGAISIASNANGYVYLQSSPTFISNGGRIAIANTSAAGGTAGLYLTGSAGIINASRASGAGGDISLSGTSTAQEGIEIANSGWKIYTNGGAISITGATTVTSAAAVTVIDNAPATYVGWDGTNAGTTGAISILGSTPAGSTAGNYGMYLGGMQIRGSGALRVGNVPNGYVSGVLFPSASTVYSTASFSSITLGSQNGGTTGGLSSNGAALNLTTAGGAISVQSANPAGNGIALASSTLTSNGGAIDVKAGAGLVSTGAINAGSGDITIIAGPSSGTASTAGAINVGALTGAVISVRNAQTGSGSGVTAGAITAAGNAITIVASDPNGNVSLGAINQNFAGANTLTVKSGRNIGLNGVFANAGAGATTVVLNSHWTNDTGVGSILVWSSITTKGGDITLGGGSDPATMPAVGDPLGSAVPWDRGVGVFATLDAGGGNITINGQGGNAAYNTLDSSDGVMISGAALRTIGTGSITVRGQGGGGGDWSQVGISIPGGTLTTVDGDITLVGTGYGVNNNPGGGSFLYNQIAGSGVGSNRGGRDGISFWGPSNLVSTSGTGDITLTGNATAAGGWSRGVRLGGSEGGTTTTISATGGGSITIDATQTANDWALTDYNNGTNVVRITTSGGTTPGHITLNGTGGSSGINLRGDIQITSSNDGNIALSGTTVGNGDTPALYLQPDNGSVGKDIIISTTGAGAISMSGTASGATGHGIYVTNVAGAGTLDVHTVDGPVTLRGVAAGSGYSGFYDNVANTYVYTSTGDIRITGANANGYALYSTHTNFKIGENANGSIVTTGAITIGTIGGDVGGVVFTATNTTIRNAGSTDISISGAGRTGGSGNANGILWSTASTGTTLVTTTADLNMTASASLADAFWLGAGSYTFAATNGGRIAITGSTTCNCNAVAAAIAGSTLVIQTSGGSTAGDITVIGSGGARGIYFANAPTISSTNGGAIALTGSANMPGYNAVEWQTPAARTTIVSTTGAGAISITGTTSTTTSNGIATLGLGATLIKAVDGSITLRGATSGVGYRGIYLGEAVNYIYSVTGAISISGASNNASLDGLETNNVTRIGWDGANLVTSGDVFIGQTGSDVGGVYFGGTENTIRTTGNLTVTGIAGSGRYGLRVQGTSLNRFYTPTGVLALTGITGGSGTGTPAMDFHGTAPTYLGWLGTGAGSSGDIVIRGQTAANSTAGAAGISFGNAQLKGSGALVIGNTDAAGASLSGFTLNAPANASGSNFTGVTLGTNGAGTTGSIYDYASFTTQANGAISVLGTGNITLNGATLDSSGAPINVRSTMNGGVYLTNSASLYSGGGLITVSNAANTNTTGNIDGIQFNGSAGVVNAGGGNIVLSGTSNAAGCGCAGIYLGGSTKIFTTGTGTVTLTGAGATGSASSFAINSVGGTSYIGWDGASTITAGAITIRGASDSVQTNSAAINLNSVILKPNGNALVIGSTGDPSGGGLKGGITLAGTTLASGNWASIDIGDAYTGSVTLNGAALNTDTATTGAIRVRAGGAYNGVAGLGNVTIQSNATLTAASAPITVQATGNVTLDGVGTRLASGGGGIDVRSTTNGYVYLVNSASLVSSGGDITISNTDLASGGHGVQFTGSSGFVNASGTSANGNITIAGRTSAPGGYSGVAVNGNPTKIFTGGTGAITITGRGNVSGAYAVTGSGANYIGWNNGATVTAGAVSIYGETAPATTLTNAVDLSAMVFKPNGQDFIVASIDRGVSGITLGSGTFAAGNWNSVAIGDASTAYVSLGGTSFATGSASSAITVVAGGLYNGTPVGGQVIASGGVWSSAGGSVNVRAGSSTVAGKVSSSVTIATNGGDITIGNGAAGTSSAMGGRGVALGGTLNAGGGNILVTGYGTLVANDTIGVDLSSTITTSGTGAITLIGQGGAGTSATAANAGVLFNNGNVTLATASGAISITGTVQANGGTWAGGVTTYRGNSAQQLRIYSNSGAISITGNNTAAPSVSAIQFDGNVGAQTYLGWDGGGTVTSGPITLTGNSMNFTANGAVVTVKGTGALTIQPYGVSTSIGIGGGTGTLSLPVSLFNGATRVFQDGFSSMTIGRLDGTGAITLNATTFTDPVNLYAAAAGGTLTVNGATMVSNGGTRGDFTARIGGNVVLNAGASIATPSAGSHIVLSTEGVGNFNNSSGSTTPLAPGSGGRWIVYSTSPGAAGAPLTQFGNMASGNSAYWGKRYSTLAPAEVGSGNRYVFVASPVVSLTTTDGVKVYGEDASAAVATQYTASLTNPTSNGVGTAYLAPVVADAINGADFTVISGGSASSANVGAYAVTFSATPATLSTGFSATYAATGVETVSARPLAISSNAAQAKVYGDDDPLSARTAYSITSGSLANGDTLIGDMGRVAGESVGAYAFTLGAVTVNDGNGGNNYALTFSGATHPFTITQKPLTALITGGKAYGADDPALASFMLTLNAVNRSVLDINGNSTSIDDSTVVELATTLTSLTRTASLATEQVGTQPFASASFGAVTGASASNYSAPSLHPSSALAIAVAPLNAAVASQTKVYGQDDPAFASVTVVLAPVQRTLGVLGGGTVAIDDTGNVSASVTGLTRVAGENVGAYNITGVTLATPTGSAATNYASAATVTGSATLTVTRANLSGAIANQTKVYGEDDPALNAITPLLASVNRMVSTWNGSVAVDDSSAAALNAPLMALTRATGEDVGTYAITAASLGALTGASAGNYNPPSLTGTPTLAIAPRALTGTITNQTKVYGTDDPALGSISAALSGLVNRHVTTWNSATTIPINDSALVTTTATALVRDAGEGAATYAITGASFSTLAGATAGNYLAPIFSGTPTLTIAPVLLTATIANQAKAYGTSDPAVAGIAPILRGALTGVAVSNWMGASTMIEDGVSATLAGLTRSPGENIGTYSIIAVSFNALTGAGAANYTAPSSLGGAPTLTITPVTLVASISNQTKVYGTSDPALAGILPTLSGVVTSASVTDWMGTSVTISDSSVNAPLVSLSRAAGETVGAYNITGAAFGALTGAGAGNYEAPATFTGSPTLTISAKSLTAAIAAQAKVYGTDDPAISGIATSLGGVVNGVTVSNWMGGALTINDSVNATLTGLIRAAGEVAGTYAITGATFGALSGAGAGNYTAPTLSGGSTLAIGAAPLAASIANQTKAYGASDPVLAGIAVSLNGLVDRTVSTWNGNVSVNDTGAVSATLASLTRRSGEDVGSYDITGATFNTVGGASAANYRAPSLSGAAVLTIAARPLSASISNPTKVYGADDPPLSGIPVTLAGTLNGSAATDWMGASTTFNDSAFIALAALTRSAGESVNSYAITGATFGALTGAGAANYTAPTALSGSPALIITAQPLSASIANQTKTYGADDPSLSSIAPALSGVLRGVTVTDWMNGTTSISDSVTVSLAALARVAGESRGVYPVTAANFGALAGAGAGNYAVPTSLSGAATLTIVPAMLTASIPNQTKLYGADDPAVGGIAVTLSGQITGRLVTNWMGATTAINDGGLATTLAGLTRAAGESVGSYAITGASFGSLSGAAAANYVAPSTFANASTLTIARAPLTGTIADLTKPYGTNDPARAGIPVGLGGLINRNVATWNGMTSVNDSAGVGTTLAGLTRAAGERVDVYAITGMSFNALTGGAADNYLTPTYAGGARLSITPLTLTATLSSPVKVYGTSDPDPASIGLTLLGVVREATVIDWMGAATPIDDNVSATLASLARQPGESVGSYVVTGATFNALTGAQAGNYTAPSILANALTLTITPRGLTASIPSQTKVYGASDPALAGIVPTLNGALRGVTVTNWMGASTSLDDSPTAALTGLTRAAGENIGTYLIDSASFGTVTGAGAGNYEWPATFTNSPTLTITPAPLTARIANQIKVYGADDPAVANIAVILDPVNRTVATWNGGASVDDSANLAITLAGLTRAAGENVGSYAITAAAFNNLTGSAAANYDTPSALTGAPTLSIHPAALTASVPSQTKIYGQDDPALASISVSLNGVVNRALATWGGIVLVDDRGDVIATPTGLTRAAGEDVGTYPVTGVVLGAFTGPAAVNYGSSATVSGAPTLTIAPAPLSASIAHQTKVYGADDPALDSIAVALAGLVNRTVASWNGYAAINDTGAVTQSLSSLSRDSGEAPGAYDITRAGLGALSGRAADNYAAPTSLTDAGTLTIAPAPLTASIANQTKVYGSSDPALSGIPVALGGVVDRSVGTWNGSVAINDTLSVTATLSALSRTPGESVGAYDITGAGLSALAGSAAGRYAVPIFIGNPTLTIAPLPLTASIANQTKTYGVSDPAPAGLAVSLNGVLNGATVSDWMGARTTLNDSVSASLAGLTRLAGEHVGDYAITGATFGPLSGAGALNYSAPAAFSGNPVLVIAARPLTATVSSQAKSYGADDPGLAGITPTLSGVVSGFVVDWMGTSTALNDNVGATLVGLARAGGEDVGSYAVTAATFSALSGAGAGNYRAPTLAPGATLAIAPALATVMSIDKPYDGSAAVNGATVAVSGAVRRSVVTWNGAAVINDSLAVTFGGGSYADRHAGSGKRVTLGDAALAGQGAGNYVLAGLSSGVYEGRSGSIAPAPLSVMAQPNVKTYDGTARAAALPVVSGLRGADTAVAVESYDDPHVGTGKRLIPAVTVNDGNGGGNYVITLVASTQGEITAVTGGGGSGDGGSVGGPTEVLPGHIAAALDPAAPEIFGMRREPALVPLDTATLIATDSSVTLLRERRASETRRLQRMRASSMLRNFSRRATPDN